MSEVGDQDVAIGKLDIVEHHIAACLQLIAVDANPYSTYVLASACREILEKFADRKGVIVQADVRPFIKDEYRGRFFKARNYPYNYFKHSDTDHDQPYIGPSAEKMVGLNEITTIWNIISYAELAGRQPAFMLNYIGYAMLRYPEAFDIDGYFETRPAAEREVFDAHLELSPDSQSAIFKEAMLRNGFLG